MPESIIYSDQWKSYESLGLLPEKYKHFTVNHSKEFLNKRTGCNTNAIESIWLKCKTKIRSLHGVHRLYLQEYLDEVIWRHNECRINHRDPKKELKFTRKVAFSKIICLLNVQNIVKLEERLKQIEKKYELNLLKLKLKQHKFKFNSDDFILSRNRIKNIRDLLEQASDDENQSEEEIEMENNGSCKKVAQISRSTQTDASSFNYKIKRKKTEEQIEKDKFFVSSRSLAEVSTQTEWSPFAEEFIRVKSSSKNSNYNLRSRIQKQ